MKVAVSAAEFTRNFDRYLVSIRREPVAVSSNGVVAGYFVRPEDFEELLRYRQARRSFATIDLAPGKADAVVASRMDPRHDHLDRLLETE